MKETIKNISKRAMLLFLCICFAICPLFGLSGCQYKLTDFEKSLVGEWRADFHRGYILVIHDDLTITTEGGRKNGTMQVWENLKTVTALRQGERCDEVNGWYIDLIIGKKQHSSTDTDNFATSPTPRDKFMLHICDITFYPTDEWGNHH